MRGAVLLPPAVTTSAQRGRGGLGRGSVYCSVCRRLLSIESV